MPRLTLKDVNANDGAPINNDGYNSAHPVRQDSARPRLILYLNAKQREEAEAAARSLRRTTATLEGYRQSLDGYAATESGISLSLLRTAWAAIRTFESISHPGHRARDIYNAARRAFDETTRLMANDIQRLLDFKLREQRAANRTHPRR